jgi:predicted AAA+ superfamily ATPase
MYEVDLILGNHLALEIKSASTVQDKHLKSIRALKEEGIIRNFAVVSRDRHERNTRDGITIFPWRHFLEKLWKGEII